MQHGAVHLDSLFPFKILRSSGLPGCCPARRALSRIFWIFVFARVTRSEALGPPSETLASFLISVLWAPCAADTMDGYGADQHFGYRLVQDGTADGWL
jgi:hypothetical protein